MATGSGVDEVKAAVAAAAAAMVAQRQCGWKKRNAYYNLLSPESRTRDWDLDAGSLFRRSFWKQEEEVWCLLELASSEARGD